MRLFEPCPFMHRSPISQTVATARPSVEGRTFRAGDIRDREKKRADMPYLVVGSGQPKAAPMRWVERMRNLRRLAEPSTWRFLALVVTDPRWEPLFHSLRARKPAQRFRDPLPWFAWHALPALEDDLRRRAGKRVLEWGSGASTLWYRQQGLVVTSIEDNPLWYEACREALGSDADLRLVPLGSYSRPEVDPSRYEVFVIDGRRRSECARFLLEHISSGQIPKRALIICDDSNYDCYGDSLTALMDVCSSHRTYSGPTSCELDKQTTLLWV